MATIATKVELALGADLTANPATWTYTDLSLRALGSVSITAGRADEAPQTQPTRCTFRLANTDGWLSPRFPTSPYYPNVRRQTPVRISLNPGTGYAQRFQGYIDNITPVWPSGNSEYAEVEIVASDITRRLGQGRNPLKSALYRAVTTASVQPSAYWSCEDGADGLGLSSAVSPIPGVSPMTAIGASNFASTDGAPGSDKQPDFTAGGSLVGKVPGSAAVTSWRVQVAWKANTIPAAGFAIPLQWTTADGHAWELDLNPGALVFSEDIAFTSPSSPAAVDNGIWHEGRVDAVQAGGNINITVYFDGVQVITESIAGTVSRVTSVEANAAGGPSNILTGIGHFIVWNGSTTVSGLNTVDSMRGHAGETATDRITRLCAEQGVPLTLSATASHIQMGPQRVDTLLNLLRECEAADGGILFGGLSAGLNYLSLPDRTNQAAAMALDCNLHQVKLPFAPVEDDQRVRNDWTVSRPNGSFARVKNTAHIAANGVYDDSTTRNVYLDAMLPDQASWLVGLGTVEEMRVPNLTLELIDRPELWASWLATTLGERLTVTNLPIQYPPGILNQIVEGYTETWDPVSWKITPNLSPYRPWEVFQIQDARLGRIETNGSTLNSSATSGATSLSVASAGGTWDTTAPPFDIEIEGEQITVNPGGISGSSSPQTFTVTRSVNGVVKAHGVNAVVKLWKPGVLSL